MKNAIPVIVTHPCTLFREGLRQLMSGTRFRPVLTAANLEASESFPSATPNCVWLMGLENFSISSFDSLRRIRMSSPELTVVVLADCHTADEVWSALEAGVSGFLDYNISRERFIKSLELIVLGEMVVPAQFLHTVRNRLADQVINQAPPALVELPPPTACVESTDLTTAEPERTEYAGMAPRLSSREMAILRLFMEGASNKVIARQLEITEATVKVHNKAILRKLRLQNRTQAAVWAHRHLGEARNGAGAITNGASH